MRRPITLKLHHAFSAVSSVHDKFLAPWARKVEAESDGRIRIDVFPSMELGGAPAQLFDQARDGDADIVWAAPGLTPGRFPKIETFELPFLPSRRALVSSRALQDFAAIYLKDEFDEVHPLCFSCADRGVVHAYARGTLDRGRQGPQAACADAACRRGDARARRAVRCRCRARNCRRRSPNVSSTAASIPGTWCRRCGLNDLLKTHTEFSDLSLSSRTYVLAMNKPAYDRLPRDLKTVLDDNSGELAAGMAGAMWDLQAHAVAENVAESGDVIVTLLPEAVAHWRKATEPVVTTWLKDMKEHKVDGGKMLASAHALLAKYADLPEPQPAPPPPEQEAVTQPQPSAQPSAQAKAAAAPAPKSDAATTPAPLAKPSPPPPAPPAAPHVATRAAGARPAPAPKLPAARPAPATASTAPTVKPIPAAPPPPPPAPPRPQHCRRRRRWIFRSSF